MSDLDELARAARTVDGGYPADARSPRMSYAVRSRHDKDWGWQFGTGFFLGWLLMSLLFGALMAMILLTFLVTGQHV